MRTDFGGDDVANALAIQRDGRIVAAGRTGRAFVLARYRPDGRPDPTFGKGGKVVTDFGAPAGKYAALDGQGAAAVAIQSDAKIVAAGGRGSEFALARYGPDGRLDPTFGRGGKVVTDVGARPGRLYKLVQGGVNGIAIQRDGKIIAAGAGPNDFALVRYKRDGRLDRSFGRGGLALTDFAHVLPAGFLQGMTNPEDYAEAVAVQADGRIVAAGRSDRLYALARYLPDGRLDPTFGRGGEVVNGGGDDYSDVKALAVQPDGKIVAAGGTGPRFPRDVLVRYTRVGRLDPSFHTGGLTVVGGHGPDEDTGASAVMLKRDGGMVVAGVDNYAADPCCSARMDFNLALVEYRRDGALDPSFGKRGTVLTRMEHAPQVNAAAIEGNGKIIIAGGIGRSRGSDFLLVSYRPTGTVGS